MNEYIYVGEFIFRLIRVMEQDEVMPVEVDRTCHVRTLLSCILQS